MLEQLDKELPRLGSEFARLSPSALLDHFRTRKSPQFLPGTNAVQLDSTARLQRHMFPAETAALIESATRISKEHRWSLLGYGEKSFDDEESKGKINWQRDPVSGSIWPLDYHGDITLASRGDGSDARVLWELNRLSHLLALGRAFAVTCDEKLAIECFAQLESWRAQNPVGRGANWACAMEVALRAINLLAVFELFRRSQHLNEEKLTELLTMFHQHGSHIRRNLEFSHISTSNHYLSDVAGLFWLGVMLPELEAAAAWREFGWRELLREMDKQILADGADYEASTGYHRFVLELFLYSFILCRANSIEIEERYWRKLRAMLDYVRAYLRPDGRAPLIGDTDGGQVLPLIGRAADDHAYLLALGAAVFKEPRFKLAERVAPEELLWILGQEGVREFDGLDENIENILSQAFTDAGTYIMRAGDLYLLFNASGSGLHGRGSHAHNDALSIEVSACGTAFMVDPGSYVYTSDLHERQLFRSTAYHSTVEVDGMEQNTTQELMPFVIGDEAHPRINTWESNKDRDAINAEHDGYARFGEPIRHLRGVEFHKRERFWIVQDEMRGEGEHDFRFRFHFNEKLEVSVRDDKVVAAYDRINGAKLFIVVLNTSVEPTLESHFVSRDYGAKSASVSACWSVRARAPFLIRFVIVPVCAGEDEMKRLELIARGE